MKLMKKIAALTMVLTMAVTAACAEATPTDIVMEAPAMVEVVETLDTVEAEVSAEGTAPEAPVTLPEGCSVRIACDDAIVLGGTITLQAEVLGLDGMNIGLQWLCNGVAMEGENAETLTLSVTADIIGCEYAVSVTLL